MRLIKGWKMSRSFKKNSFQEFFTMEKKAENTINPCQNRKKFSLSSNGW